eukprot:g74941.t1
MFLILTEACEPTAHGAPCASISDHICSMNRQHEQPYWHRRTAQPQALQAYAVEAITFFRSQWQKRTARDNRPDCHTQRRHVKNFAKIIAVKIWHFEQSALAQWISQETGKHQGRAGRGHRGGSRGQTEGTASGKADCNDFFVLEGGNGQFKKADQTPAHSVCTSKFRIHHSREKFGILSSQRWCKG